MKSLHFFSFICFGLLFSKNVIIAQSPDCLWANGIGGSGNDYCYAMVLDPNGSGDFYTTGQFQGTVDFDPGGGKFNLTSKGSWDYFISKLDGSGNLIWAKSIGGTSTDGCQSIALDPNNGDVYSTGWFFGTVDFDSGPGTFNLTSEGSWDVFISKIDAAGNFVWAKSVGGLDSEFGRSLIVDNDGNVYITGEFRDVVDFDPGPTRFELTSKGNVDIFICKLDSLGNFIWAKGMGGLEYEGGESIALDLRGNTEIFITGYFSGTVDFNPGPETFNLASIGTNDIFISKLDASGNFIWAKSMGGAPANAFAWSIQLDAFGNVYSTGSFTESIFFENIGIYSLTSAGKSDIFILKLDNSGKFIWAKSMGGANYDEAYSLDLDPTGMGDVYTTGYFDVSADFDPGADTFNLSSLNGSSDIFVSKLDHNGNFVWAKSFGGTRADIGYYITLDAVNQVHLAGNYFSSSVSFDSSTITNASTTAVTSDGFIAKLNIDMPSSTNDDKTKSIIIYPNPTTNILNFEFEQDQFFNLSINLYTTLGDLVFKSKNPFTINKKTIDISLLAPGIYFIELIGNGNRAISKIVKE